MKQVLIKDGSVCVDEVPAPAVGAKNVLVEVRYSCISVGTEMASVVNSGLPLYRRALKQPENVKRVLTMMKDQGVARTLSRVRDKLAAGIPAGYSAAGVVIARGEEVDLFRPGDLVACAGAGIANHAEIIDVPVNLAVKIPDGLGLDMASTVTLGAIALQGVRRAQPTLGETVAVIGLGILGQITIQLLRANGCKVIGVDVDPHRIRLGCENGLEHGLDSTLENFAERVYRVTDGVGADAVIITAATSSHQVISDAMQACRKKGRVVLVGDVGLHLNRADLYVKELDFLMSTSYGPGRYDPYYEEAGLDYPLAYVRWTENRNMEAYLRLLADGSISLQNLLAPPYEIDRAGEAYEALKGTGEKPLLVLLHYPAREEARVRTILHRQTTPKQGTVKVALAGAGGFAQAVHLPNLLKLSSDFSLTAVMSRTGSNAKAIAAQYGAGYSSTDYKDILSDASVDLVMIATRHNLHARMVIEALIAGKDVFVEKPLATTEDELDRIEQFFAEAQNPPLLMTGFNRRFSPAIAKIGRMIERRASPLIVNYKMNAGYIPRDHWVHTAEGGGRNIGEACHIYDLFNFLTKAAAVSVQASAIKPASPQWKMNDNFVAAISYADGSVCTLIYTALGHKEYPKETMEIFVDGKVITMIDFKSITVTGGKGEWRSRSVEKGQFEELQSLADCLLRKGSWPISLEQQIEATRISFDVERQITSGATPLNQNRI